MSYDLDKLSEIIAFKLGMEEEPVILWPLCGYEAGWCMSPEGCIHILKYNSISMRVTRSRKYSCTNPEKCEYRTMIHPEYDISFEEDK